jgi:chemotaxis protein CheD
MVNISDTSIADEAHYWDHRFQRQTIKLLPGDFDVVNGKQMLVTVLGSCIAACIRDKKKLIGGMNHFLLPTDRKIKSPGQILDYDNAATRYGDLAMERLINDIIARGGIRENFETKIFGGARMFNSGMSDVGSQNIEFVKAYLKTEGIRISKEDVGGDHARKVYYIPSTGDVFLKRINKVKNNTIELRELSYLKQAKSSRTTAQIEFFD